MRMVMVTARMTTTATRAAIAPEVERRVAVRAATATQASPQQRDEDGASRPRAERAISTPTRPATAITPTAQTSALMPKPPKPAATSTAVTFAAVAMLTQPR